MVEYSFHQLMGLCSSIMDICKKHGLTGADLDSLRVRLSDPDENGKILIDLGLPKPWRVPMS